MDWLQTLLAELDSPEYLTVEERYHLLHKFIFWYFAIAIGLHLIVTSIRDIIRSRRTRKQMIKDGLIRKK
ncbi:MAG: hypothetical protein E1N59_1706 [Puniceicoccaceae bacterium 5H]|nr:MAG: hypothetical protein E1N59_1706 [Puniceicoccaceae bacterium 5H]